MLILQRLEKDQHRVIAERQARSRSSRVVLDLEELERRAKGAYASHCQSFEARRWEAIERRSVRVRLPIAAHVEKNWQRPCQATCRCQASSVLNCEWVGDTRLYGRREEDERLRWWLLG